MIDYLDILIKVAGVLWFLYRLYDAKRNRDIYDVVTNGFILVAYCILSSH